MPPSLRMDHFRVFAPEFMDALASRRSLRCTGFETSSAGPFRVVARDQRFAVVNDPEPDDGPAVGEFTEEQWALLTAATYGAHYRERTLRLTDRDETGQFTVIERYLSGDSRRVVGWMPYSVEDHLESVHVAEYILRSPHRLAHLLEAAGDSALRDAAKILTRRLGLRDPETRSGEQAEAGRVTCRYRLEVVTETTLEYEGGPLKSGDEQARWLAEVVPRSPIEVGGGLYLDPDFWPIGYTQYDGGFHSISLEPRHLFAPALLLNAAYVTMWHTHPDQQEPKPSEGDRGSIIRFQHCGRYLRIPVLTSIILGADQRYVFVPI